MEYEMKINKPPEIFLRGLVNNAGMVSRQV